MAGELPRVPQDRQITKTIGGLLGSAAATAGIAGATANIASHTITVVLLSVTSGLLVLALALAIFLVARWAVLQAVRRERIDQDHHEQAKIKDDVAEIKRELKPNGGCSLRDRIDQTREKIDLLLKQQEEANQHRVSQDTRLNQHMGSSSSSHDELDAKLQRVLKQVENRTDQSGDRSGD